MEEGAGGDRFGASVASEGKLAAIGSPGRSAGRGAVQLLELDGGTWYPAAALHAALSSSIDGRGTALSLVGPSLIAGAPRSDATAPGAGAAYLHAMTDCNDNGVPDACDIALGDSFDWNENRQPDECERATRCAGKAFRRGDCDGNGSVHPLLDSLFLLTWQFLRATPPSCLDAADVDGDDRVNALLDAVFLLSWQFSGGRAPPAPGLAACGPDDDADSNLDCAETSANCE